MINYFWVLSWAIWLARNQLCFNNFLMSHEAVLSLCSKILLEFHDANGHCSKKGCSNKGAWTKPDVGWVKLNSDAGNYQNGLWGLGVVGRDENGEIIVAGNVRQRASTEIICAEAEALKWGLQLASDCSLKKIEVESDNVELIAALCNNAVYLTDLGDLLKDIREISERFDMIKWRAIPRRSNQVAHFLAKEAVSEEHIWIEDLPHQFHKVLREDMIDCSNMAEGSV